jgi:hypothetical protein
VLSFFTGLTAENSPEKTNYYSDPDGVVRRGMAAYIGNTLAGQPLAPGSTGRSIILNRPFKSIAELGHVFSGTPWKNIDFFTPESAYPALLDLFCINSTPTGQSPLEAGRINLNTRSRPTLAAMISGASKDPASGTAMLSETEVSNIVDGLLAFISSTSEGKGPLRNISEIVGRYIGNDAEGYSASDPAYYQSTDQEGNKPTFCGFSGALTTLMDTTNNGRILQRKLESAVRALSGAGDTRVWNLLIDCVAQVGLVPATADSPEKFSMAGETRIWVHLALDRLTGEVLDMQVEEASR